MAQVATPSLPSIVFSRLAYGPTPADVAAFNALPGATASAKFARWVDQQLSPASIDDSACENLIRAGGADLLELSQEALWDKLMVKNPYTEKPEDNDKEYELKQRGIWQVKRATLLRAVHSKRQLFEILVDFWHNHFSVNAVEIEEIYATFPAYDTRVIRANALGNFRVMLEAVARSAPMQIYLNNAVNRDEGPNENYARELLELHTLGADNYLGVRDPNTVPRDKNGVAIGYVDNDVYEVARCFTGWTYDMNADWWKMGNTGAFLYRKDWHDRFNKVVMGKYLPPDQPDLKDGRDVLDLLAAHPGTAKHIATKLCRRLISDNPPVRIVNEAARVFLDRRNDREQLKWVVRTIVLSPEFQNTFGEKIRRPFEAAAAMLRAVNARINMLDGLLWTYDLAGQPLFARRPPDGYPDRISKWSNTLSLLHRWRLAIIATENWMREGEDKPLQVEVDILRETPADKRTPEAAVDYWTDRILLRPLPDAHRDELVKLMREVSPNDKEAYAEYLKNMVQLIIMSPDFQLR